MKQLLRIRIELNRGEMPVVEVTPLGTDITSITTEVVVAAMQTIFDEFSLEGSHASDMKVRCLKEMLGDQKEVHETTDWFRFEDDDDEMWQLQLVDC